MGKFKVGDRVEVTEDIVEAKKGMIGTIIGRFADNWYSIRFDDKFVGGHDCRRSCDYGHGYNLNDKFIKLISCDFSIHIYTDGTTTTAILKDGKKTVKKAQAKCSPDGTYDFAIGAKLAFERLMGVEEKPVREVKRTAKAGEYIKITHTLYSFDKIGDILKVDGRDHMAYVLGKSHPRNTDRDYEHWHYADIDYVVLENYKPKIEDKPLEVIINGERYIKEE